MEENDRAIIGGFMLLVCEHIIHQYTLKFQSTSYVATRAKQMQNSIEFWMRGMKFAVTNKFEEVAPEVPKEETKEIQP